MTEHLNLGDLNGDLKVYMFAKLCRVCLKDLYLLT